MKLCAASQVNLWTGELILSKCNCTEATTSYYFFRQNSVNISIEEIGELGLMSTAS